MSHLPYGEEWTATANDRVKFATYWRDGNTGLDYAWHRQYAAVYGRFTSPDPYQASGGPTDPGSWNQYAYVVGDPVNFVDPMGLLQCPAGSQTCVDVYDTYRGIGGGGGGGGSYDGPSLEWAPLPEPGYGGPTFIEAYEECKSLPDAITLSTNGSAGVLFGVSGISFDLVLNARSGTSSLYCSVMAGGGVGSGAGVGVSVGAVWNIGSGNENYGRESAITSVQVSPPIATPFGALSIGGQFNDGSWSAGISVGIPGLRGLFAGVSHGRSSGVPLFNLPQHFGRYLPAVNLAYEILRLSHERCAGIANALGVSW